ncbi:MAG: SusC/RagA family TonB-linked outer membrane protein [Bacteroidales bacterium]|nr:SusC/RagA family TonB-linked outer membrane protein [Bacteroidales bacterium]
MKKLTLMIAVFVLVGLSALYAQTTVITGTVTSSVEGEGTIPGVAVTVYGTTIGTQTDMNGIYSLEVPATATQLVFQFIGMKTVEETIDGRTTINVVLEPDLLGIDEVVVTALGITREKKALGYSVQDVSGEELNRAKETNIVNSLQGKIAGVQITNASGAVGASAQILIRGVNSFGDNQPLWVIDGTPISNSSSGASQWSGVDYGNNASDIDPENIESISVLKGANAAALYGSRARNGVVMITTKKGKARKGLGMSFTSNTTFENVNFLPAYQNEYGQGINGSEFIYKRNTEPGDAYEGWTYQEWADGIAFRYVDGLGGGRNDGVDESWGPRLDDGLVLDQFFGEDQPWVSNPDNVKDFFVTGITTSNNLTVSGGSDKMTGRMSYTNLYQTGAIPNTDQMRNSLNATSTINITDKLKAELNINYINTSNDNLPGQGYSSQNVMQSIGGWFGRQVDMKLLEENWETYMPNGYPYNWNSNYHNNPYWTVNKNTSSRERNRVFGNAVVSYQINDWLNLMGRYGLDYYTEFRKSVTFEGSNSKPVGTGGSFSQNNRESREINAEVFLNFNRQIGTDFDISGNIGGNYRSGDFNYMSLGASELTVPNFFVVGNVKGVPSTGMFQSHFETNSLFGALNLAFRDYLFLDLTFRNDWSSTLPPDNWSYPYPSASLGWIFTETFAIDQTIFSFGKLRASYAKVGSDTGPYRLAATYDSYTAFSGMSQYSYPGQIPPANLKPEMSTSMEFGGDFKFFMNRVGLDASYYNTITNNQIMAVNVSTSSGFSSMLINAGEIETSGLELLLYGDILRNPSGLNWRMTVNWSTMETMVNELAEGVEKYQLNSSWSPTTVEARVNEPFGQIYGVGYVRNEDGQKLTRNGYYIKTTGDPVLIGNTMPDWVGSIRNDFSYKGVNLGFLIDAKWGGDIYSVTKWFGDYAGITQTTVEGGIRENGLIAEGIDETTGEPNTIAVAPQNFFAAYWGATEPAVFDGSYIKFREFSIGYNIPVGNISFLNSLNLSFIGRNLAILYVDPSNDIRIDPETGYGTGTSAVGIEQYQIPSVRSLGFKIRAEF